MSLYQYLIEVAGKTYCISNPSGPLSSVDTVRLLCSSRLGELTAASSLLLEKAQQWRLMHAGRFLAPSGPAPEAPAVLRLWLGGLKGGKGGFGAELRMLAKQAGKKATKDFGACRDLQGRRLRHVNDEIRLQKWHEDQKKKERGEKIEDIETPSGIDDWYLGIPSWAEGLEKATKGGKFMKARRKTRICLQWLEARRDRPAPKGAPPWWGCPRGSRCSFAHGEEELVGTAADEARKARKEKFQMERQKALDAYMKASSTANDTLIADMAGAVEQGLKAAIKSKKRKLEEDTDKKEILPIEDGSAKAADFTLEEPEVEAEVPLSHCPWADILAGAVSISDAGEVEGVSGFGTAGLKGLELKTGRWYYEVTLLTGGVMQIGWACKAFQGSSVTGDGVGDDKHSWGYDGARRRRWNGEADVDEAPEYGQAWKAGDVVGCQLDADRGQIAYTLNGRSLGIAFNGVKPVGGFFPAGSVEQEEVR
ncbi:unnamed protein product [Chrysoparadoxa australica]